ncbi:MAG: hypothetical protein R3C59_10745 [Planctomycetaceae bacterium]
MKISWPRKRGRLLLAGAIVGSTLIYLAVSTQFHEHVIPQPFNSREWLAAGTEGGPPLERRYRMLPSLVDEVLPGKNEQEVRVMLGESVPRSQTLKGKVLELHRNLDWDLMYAVGQEPRQLRNHRGEYFSLEQQFFFLRFGSDGKFSSWFLYGSRQINQFVSEAGLDTFQNSRTREETR